MTNLNKTSLSYLLYSYPLEYRLTLIELLLRGEYGRSEHKIMADYPKGAGYIGEITLDGEKKKVKVLYADPDLHNIICYLPDGTQTEVSKTEVEFLKRLSD